MNIFERSARRIDATQQSHGATAFVFAVMKKYGDDNGGGLASQFTYSMFVTIFPLLLLLITILGIVLARNPSDRHRVLASALGQFPIVGQQLGRNVHALKRSSMFGLVVGLVGLLYGSTGLAQSGLYAMEQIWNIPNAVRPNYVTRISRSLLFLAVLAVGLIVTTTLAGFGTFGRHNVALGLVGEVLAALVNIGLYLAAFRTLTPRQIATRSLIPGVVVGGLAWTALQAVGGYIVGHDLRGASALYGLFGLVLGLLAWIYLGTKVTFYAAELNTVWHHRLWPRSMVQPPLTEADQRSLAFQATENQRRPEQVVSTRFRERPMDQNEYRRRGYTSDNTMPGIERTVPEHVEPPSPANHSSSGTP